MKKVAVIGAGISGLFIANLFKRNKKYQITIFERNSLINSKVQFGKLATGEFAIKINTQIEPNTRARKKDQITLLFHNRREMQQWIGGIRCMFAGTENDVVNSSSMGGESCTICIDDFVHGQILTILPCNHRFCPSCIKQWLDISTLCPCCKQDVAVRVDNWLPPKDESQENLNMRIIRTIPSPPLPRSNSVPSALNNWINSIEDEQNSDTWLADAEFSVDIARRRGLFSRSYNGRYETNPYVWAGRAGVMITDPVYWLMPWTRAAQAGKLLGRGGVELAKLGGGVGAVDAATRSR